MAVGSSGRTGDRVDDLVQYVTLHTPSHVLLSGSVLPFMGLYAVWAYLWVAVYGIEEYWEAGLLTLAGIGFVQVFVCLCCFWSVHVQTFLNCRKVSAGVVGGGRGWVSCTLIFYTGFCLFFVNKFARFNDEIMFYILAIIII